MKMDVMNKSYDERLEMAEDEFATACEMHEECIGIIGLFKEALFGDNGWQYNTWYEIKSKYGV